MIDTELRSHVLCRICGQYKEEGGFQIRSADGFPSPIQLCLSCAKVIANNVRAVEPDHL